MRGRSPSEPSPPPRAEQAWPRGQVAPPLGPAEVHVWLVRLDVAAPRLERLRSLLDPAERERGARPVYQTLRDRFIAARGALRELLGAYLAMPPRDIRLAYGDRGKPRLLTPDGGLHFNLAHTGDVAMVGLSRDADVGVDVEREREVDHAAVSARMFSAAERASLLALPAARRRAAFFACWSYKEAYVKAHGDGLTIDTTRFDAWRPTLGDGDRTRVQGDDVDGHWEIVALRPLAGHPAAVCTRGDRWRVVRGEWVGGE